MTAPWPSPLPKWFWVWALWRDRGGIPAERPTGIPEEIPRWAWLRYQLHRGSRPAPPPASYPFAGVGCFADERPFDAIPYAAHLDWVACRYEHLDLATAAALRAAGVKVHVWEEPASRGLTAVTAVDADGYIATVEGPDQAGAALRVAPDLRDVPRALIVNDTVQGWGWWAGWTCIAEAYTSLNQQATADQVVRDFKGRGAKAINVCVLLADEGGSRMLLDQYMPAIRFALAQGAIGWSFFRLETLALADIEALGLRGKT